MSSRRAAATPWRHRAVQSWGASCAAGPTRSRWPAAPGAPSPVSPPASRPGSASSASRCCAAVSSGTRCGNCSKEAFGGPAGSWSLDERFHFGGYARTTPALHAFADDFEQRHGLPVERLYVAKLLYALTELAGEGAFPPGTTVAAVVTGSPQGAPDSSR